MLFPSAENFDPKPVLGPLQAGVISWLYILHGASAYKTSTTYSQGITVVSKNVRTCYIDCQSSRETVGLTPILGTKEQTPSIPIIVLLLITYILTYCIGVTYIYNNMYSKNRVFFFLI